MPHFFSSPRTDSTPPKALAARNTAAHPIPKHFAKEGLYIYIYMAPLGASEQHASRRQLDSLFLTDACLSVAFGVAALVSPHRAVSELMMRGIWGGGGMGYSHAAHEALRLYGCLRIALGWILYRARAVDDGRFRRAVTEALCACYGMQALAVLRAQLTDGGGGAGGEGVRGPRLLHWLALAALVAMGVCYGRIRFGRGGARIKIYELPSSVGRSER